jgi:hypothetical protein
METPKNCFYQGNLGEGKIYSWKYKLFLPRNLSKVKPLEFGGLSRV